MANIQSDPTFGSSDALTTSSGGYYTPPSGSVGYRSSSSGDYITPSTGPVTPLSLDITPSADAVAAADAAVAADAAAADAANAAAAAAAAALLVTKAMIDGVMAVATIVLIKQHFPDFIGPLCLCLGQLVSNFTKTLFVSEFNDDFGQAFLKGLKSCLWFTAGGATPLLAGLFIPNMVMRSVILAVIGGTIVMIAILIWMAPHKTNPRVPRVYQGTIWFTIFIGKTLVVVLAYFAQYKKIKCVT